MLIWVGTVIKWVMHMQSHWAGPTVRNKNLGCFYTAGECGLTAYLNLSLPNDPKTNLMWATGTKSNTYPIVFCVCRLNGHVAFSLTFTSLTWDMHNKTAAEEARLDINNGWRNYNYEFINEVSSTEVHPITIVALTSHPNRFPYSQCSTKSHCY